MTETAATQLRRVMRFIAEISDGERRQLDVIAERLGVSRDVLLKDLASITGDRDDAPGGFVEGVSIEWDEHGASAFTSHFRRPMRLTMRELCALELALSVLRRERAPEDQGGIDRALKKLRTAITEVPGDDRWQGIQHVEPGGAGDPLLPAVSDAVRECQKLRISYSASSGAEGMTRTIHPYGVVLGRGVWYLVAWCERSDALRNFRLDRIESVELTGDERFERPSGFSVDNLFDGDKVFHMASSTTTMTVRYSARVAPWIAEREGKELAEDGSVTLEHPLADRTWAVRHVLQYGAEAEVLEPASLRGEIRSRLARMMG